MNKYKKNSYENYNDKIVEKKYDTVLQLCPFCFQSIFFKVFKQHLKSCPDVGYKDPEQKEPNNFENFEGKSPNTILKRKSTILDNLENTQNNTLKRKSTILDSIDKNIENIEKSPNNTLKRKSTILDSLNNTRKSLIIETNNNLDSKNDKVNQSTILNKLEKQDLSKLKWVLTKTEKDLLFKAISYNSILNFKKLILEEEYSILADISDDDIGWTSFHFVMDYGDRELVLFSFDYLDKLNILNEALKLVTKDGKDPIMCLLRSYKSLYEGKRLLMEIILSNYKIDLTNQVKDEMMKKDVHMINMKDLLYKYNIKFNTLYFDYDY